MNDRFCLDDGDDGGRHGLLARPASFPPRMHRAIPDKTDASRNCELSSLNDYFNPDCKRVNIERDIKVNGTKPTTLKVDPNLISVGVGLRF